MIKIIDHPQSNLIETLSSGRLDKEDYEKLKPLLEQKFNRWGKIRWYFEMNDFKSWTGGGLWEDLKIDVKHRNDFEKIAIIGEKSWQEKMSQMIKPFTDARVKYFDLNDKLAAKEWIEYKE